MGASVLTKTNVPFPSQVLNSTLHFCYFWWAHHLPTFLSWHHSTLTSASNSPKRYGTSLKINATQLPTWWKCSDLYSSYWLIILWPLWFSPFPQQLTVPFKLSTRQSMKSYTFKASFWSMESTWFSTKWTSTLRNSSKASPTLSSASSLPPSSTNSGLAPFSSLTKSNSKFT